MQIIGGLLLGLCALVLVWLGFWLKSIMRRGAPFVALPPKVLLAIAKAISPPKGSVIYDLGCGDGRVLFVLSRAFPDIDLVGMEIEWVPYVLARLRKALNNYPRVRIIRADIFTISLSSATHIFAYLTEPVLDKLKDTLKNKCKPGVRIYTCDFTIPGWTPIQTTNLPRTFRKIGSALYTYIID